MGTALTGLEIRDTYDALIKISDNGPIGATAKYIGDGLGNDSKLSLSDGNIGINTTTPSTDFHVNGSVRITGAIYDSNNQAGTNGQVLTSTGTALDWKSLSEITGVDGTGTANYVAKWSDTDTITNSLLFDNGTNVGIGTSSPDTKLEIQSTSSAGASLKLSFDTTPSGTVTTNDVLGQVLFEGLDASGGGTVSGVYGRISSIADGLWDGSSGVGAALTLSTAQYNGTSVDLSERMRITSAGLVGIGTSAPTAALHIIGADENQLRLGTAASEWYQIGRDASSGFLYFYGSQTSYTGYVFTGVDGERMRITSAGAVGIGTSAPTATLSIKPSASNNSNNLAQVITNSEFRLQYRNDENAALFIGGLGSQEGYIQGVDNAETSGKTIALNPYGGNVGIGTSAPSGKLHVKGDIRIERGSTTDFSIIDNDGNLNIKAATGGVGGNFNITFQVGGAERMRIDASGNVGIGTSSPAAPLEVLGLNEGEYLRVGAGTISGRSLTFSSASNSGFSGVSHILNVQNSSGILDFRIAGTSKVTITNNGLTFNGDTAAANALDDYEEGTWTPSVGNTGGTGSATYTSRLGTYTKIGRQVVIQFYIDFQKNTLSGGTLAMTGLPFTAQASIYPECAILIDNLATALSNPLLQIGANSTSSDIIQGNGGTGSHAGLSVDTYLSGGTMTLRGTATYFV